MTDINSQLKNAKKKVKDLQKEFGKIRSKNIKAIKVRDKNLKIAKVIQDNSKNETYKSDSRWLQAVSNAKDATDESVKFTKSLNEISTRLRESVSALRNLEKQK